VKIFLPIFKMNFPEIVDIALPAEGVFHNLVFSGVARAPSRVVFGALAKPFLGVRSPQSSSRRGR